MSPLQQPLRATLCVASGFFAFQLIHSAFIAFGALSWHRLETRQALQEPISPNNRPTRGRAVTTKSPPSATEPRKWGGSTQRPPR